jgi:7-carboxy-7-deazaguanine synthase
VNELTHFAHQNAIFMTMETEGSHFLATDFPIDLISLSPKFSNSIPVLGVATPMGKITDERMIKQHNKRRLNYKVIRQLIDYHHNYHIKPVLDKALSSVKEIEQFQAILGIPDDKIWVMPAGDDRDSLMKSYGVVMNFVRDRGWRFTPRPHIMAFDTKRCV